MHFDSGRSIRMAKEAVGGVVIARYGVNTLEVIDAVKQKIEDAEGRSARGRTLVPFYDRTQLIHRATEHSNGH